VSDTIKVTELPTVVTPLVGNEMVMVVQSGTSRRCTVSDIASGGTAFANPTASVGLSAVNGVATTAMRSDAAPVLSQSIVPTWTGAHTFSNNVALNGTTTVSGSSIRDTALFTSGTLGVTRGGTGVATFAQGDLIYATALNTLSALPKNTSTTRYLSNTGASNNPAWAQVDLTSGVTAELPIENGGTGQATANDALNALLPDQSGQSGNVLTSDGTDTFWSTGSGGAAAPDIVFIADTVGVGAEGYSNFGTTGGTLVFQGSRISGVYGFSGYSLLSVAPSEMEFRVEDAEVSQNYFTSLNVEEWGQTFDTADALFSNPGGDSLWHWNSAEAEFVPEGQYTIRLSGDPA